MVTLVVTLALAALVPLLSPSIPSLRASIVLSTATGMPNLLVACDGSAAHLEKILSKDELKAECAARSLPLSGTKAVLAPRLLQALIVESATQAATQADMQAAPLPPPLPADLLPQSAASPAPAATRPTRASAATKPPALATDAIKSVDTTCAVPAVDAAAAATAAAWGASGADMEVSILGSGACFPSPARGASCTALRVRDSYWLFDVGEGTQVQLQRCWVRPSKIDKIFITHAHGDHAFGLPGLLCLIANGRPKNAPPLEIYGPHGLRAFIRVSLSFTGTRKLPAYVVHELHQVPPKLLDCVLIAFDGL